MKILGSRWARGKHKLPPPPPLLAFSIVAAIVFLVVSVSLPANKLIIGGDSAWPVLNPSIAIAQRSSSWAGFAGLGRDSSLYLPLLPMAVIDAGMKLLGLSTVAINHIWMFLLIGILALGTIRFYTQLFGGAKQRIIPAVFAGCAAFLNPYILLTFHTPNPPLDLCIAAAPFVFASGLAFMLHGRKRNLIEFIFWLFVATPGNTNVAYVAEYAVVLCAMGAIAFVRSRRRSLATMRTASALFIFASINLVLWVPIYHFVSTSYASLTQASQIYSADTLLVTSQYSPLSSVLRLVGGYLFFNSIQGVPYVPEGASYLSNPLIVIASCVLPALALACCLLAWRSRLRVLVLAITVCTLGLVFFAKGISAPFGHIMAWLFLHIGVFQALRDSFGKLGWLIVLCYALLGARSLAFLEERSRRVSIPILVIAFAGLAVAGYPILFGHLFYAGAKVAIPRRYEKLEKWLEQQPISTRLLQLPTPNSIFVKYNWGFRGSGVITNLTDRAVLSPEFDFLDPGTSAIDDVARNYDHIVGSDHFARLLGEFGVTHIVGDTAMELSTFGETPTEPGYAGPLPGTTRVARFGTIDVLRIDPHLVEPRVYAADRAIMGVSDLEQMSIACDRMNCHNAVFVPSQMARFLGINHASRFRFAPFEPRPEERVYVRQPSPLTNMLKVIHRNANGISGLGTAHAPAVLVGASSSDTFVPVGTSTAMDLPKSCLGTVAVRQISGLPVGKVLALVLNYSATHPAFLSLQSAGGGGFVAPLHSGATRFVRLFRLAGGGTTTLTIGAYSGASHCLRVRSLQIAVARGKGRWRLLGGDADLFSTSPFNAANANSNPRVTPLFTEERLASPKMLDRHPFVSPGGWTGYDVNAGVDKGITLRLRTDNSATLSVRDAVASARGSIGSVIPGERYIFSLPIYNWEGYPPRLMVISQTGAVLLDRFLQKSEKQTVIKVPIVNPEGSGYWHVYLRENAIVGGPSFLRFGSPLARFQSPDAWYTYESGARLPSPHLRIRRLSGSSYALAVTKAPNHYVVVLNNSYSDDWHAIAPPGVRVRHFVANLYTNGWLVTGAGAYTLRLEYGGAKYIRRGLWLSLIALGIALGFYAIERLGRRRMKSDEGAPRSN